MDSAAKPFRPVILPVQIAPTGVGGYTFFKKR
jgi:hypothetical protein